MKRKLVSMLLVCSMMSFSFAACGKKTATTNEPAKNAEEKVDDTTVADDTASDDKASDSTDVTNGEVVDGKFVTTRKITVEVFDRSNDGGSKPEDNVFTNYIKEGMLRDHNVEVEFVPVPRWTEIEQLNNLLAAGDAPDICVTYDYPTVQTYSGMGGVVELNQYLDQYAEFIPNFTELLGTANINWDKDPATDEIWAVEAKLAVLNRINTFVREDWLKKLNLAEPTTLEEFEKVLIAFRDNAETLLGDEADKMIPFSIGTDVGWRSMTLIESFLDPNLSDREYYVNGYDDRKLTQNGTKEAIRVLNKWYNDGLIWKDFALYDKGDTTEDNLMKAGYVGAFIHNWDYPYRDGENSVDTSLKRLVGEDAKFVAIDTFKNSNGDYLKYQAGPIDRKIFFPKTNDEVLASFMYLDWISTPENLQYLQIGEEGINHETQADGSIKTLAAVGEYIMNSPLNIDYTITCNGLKLADPDLTLKSRALSYSNIDPALVERADAIANSCTRVGKNVNVGKIESEEGLGTSLTDKRDVIYDNSVTAKVEDFDKIFDDGIKDYLASGGQAVMDERAEKWVSTFGDVDQLPE